MPNTLAHLGVQSIATRTLIRDSDLKWIFFGCIIPDIPWIIQRIIHIVLPGVDAYELRLYAVVQASFFFCLLLSMAIARLSNRHWKTFVILGFGSLLHLFLDALETKWGNGVHFFAPLDWRMTNFNFFWPESFPTYLITAFGLVYFAICWKHGLMIPYNLTIRSARHIAVTFIILCVYLLFPIFFLEGPESANNHFVKTLRAQHDRPGRYIEIDRGNFNYRASGSVLHTFAGEELKVKGVEIQRSTVVSVRATFNAENEIFVHEYHVHSPSIRDSASYLGLTLIAMLWIVAYIRQFMLEK